MTIGVENTPVPLNKIGEPYEMTEEPSKQSLFSGTNWGTSQLMSMWQNQPLIETTLAIARTIETLGANSPIVELVEPTPTPIFDIGTTTYKREVPNKIAQTDPKWGNKVAWSSKDLWTRQLELETYSAEVAMMFEGIRTIAQKAVGRNVTHEELEFSANFGSPITENKQRIAILLTKPLELRVFLIRELVGFKLKWTAEVGYGERTPLIAGARLTDAKRLGGELAMNPVAVTSREAEEADAELREEKKRRKVKL